MKKAFIVKATIMTRVVVDVKVGENNLDDEEKIIVKALPNLIENLQLSPYDSIEDIYEDEEMPYDESIDN
jgi:hypothetical protein